MTTEQKDRHRQLAAQWRERNRERAAKNRNLHYHENRDKYLAIEADRFLKKAYGITLRDYDDMDDHQGRQCAICGKPRALMNPTRRRRFAVDHDHSNGQVRGLLCTRCNSTLGWFEAHRSDILRYLDTQLGVIHWEPPSDFIPFDPTKEYCA